MLLKIVQDFGVTTRGLDGTNGRKQPCDPARRAASVYAKYADVEFRRRSDFDVVCLLEMSSKTCCSSSPIHLLLERGDRRRQRRNGLGRCLRLCVEMATSYRVRLAGLRHAFADQTLEISAVG